MKKIMILVLSLAVLFGFAACDNSTPDATTPEGTPVSVDATRLAAQQVNALLFEANGIDIPSIITGAGNSDVKASGETVVITKNYPNGGAIVGSVTLTLDGTYTAAKGSDPAELAVTEYTIAATDLQVSGYNDPSNQLPYYGDAEKITFSISGAVAGDLVYTFNSNGSITKTGEIEATEVYTTLPVQNASITMNIPVSRTTTGYIYESKTISGAAFIEALATVAGDDHSAYKFMEDEFAKYWAQINANDTGILAAINDYLADPQTNTADKADATVTYAGNAITTEGSNYKQTGTVTVVFTGDDFAFGTATMNGEFTLVFSTERTASTEAAINTTAIVATGYTLTADDVKFTGAGYPLTVSGDMVGTGLTTTTSSESVKFTVDAEGALTKAAITDLGDIAGSVTANGVSFEF